MRLRFVRLTSGWRDLPVCSPDQKWLYYQNADAEQIGGCFWAVSGKPEPVPAGVIQAQS